MDVLTLFAVNVINHTYRTMSEFKMFPTKEDGTKDYLKQISVSLARKKIRLACSKNFVPLAFALMLHIWLFKNVMHPSCSV